MTNKKKLYEIINIHIKNTINLRNEIEEIKLDESLSEEAKNQMINELIFEWPDSSEEIERFKKFYTCPFIDGFSTDWAYLSQIDSFTRHKISGMFLISKIDKNSVSNGKVSVDLLYINDNDFMEINNVTVETLRKKNFPKLLEKYNIFIEEMFLPVVSSYLQHIVSKADELADILENEYVHNQIGYREDSLDEFYASRSCNTPIQSVITGKYASIVKTEGTFDEYIDMLKTDVNTSVMQLGLCFAFVAPVAYRLSANNLNNNVVINLVGESSKGKSTTQQLAQSVFASPVLTKDGIYISSECTPKSLTRCISSTNGILVGIDDISKFQHRHKDGVEDLIYRLEEGLGDSVGNWGGVSHSSQFKGAILMSSEKTLLDKSFKEGAAVRICEFTIPAWTTDADSADRIKYTTTKNHGIIGPMFMDYFLSQYSVEETSELFHRVKNDFIKCITMKDQFTQRIADRLSVILTSVILARDFFDSLDIDYSINVKEIKELLLCEENKMYLQRNEVEEIYASLVEFVTFNMKKFITSSNGVDFNKTTIYGRIIEKHGACIACINSIGEEKFTKAHGQLNTSTLKKMIEKGYLSPSNDADSAFRTGVSINGKSTRCLRVVLPNNN